MSTIFAVQEEVFCIQDLSKDFFFAYDWFLTHWVLMNSSMCKPCLSQSSEPHYILEKCGLFESPTDREVASEFQEQTYHGIFLSRNRCNIQMLCLFKSMRVSLIPVPSCQLWKLPSLLDTGGDVAFFFLSTLNFLFRCYRFDGVFRDVFHVVSKCAEGKFFWSVLNCLPTEIHCGSQEVLTSA